MQVDRIKGWQESKGFVVVCMDEGQPVLATHQLFDKELDALQYAKTVPPLRLPQVFQVRKADNPDNRDKPWTAKEILEREG